MDAIRSRAERWLRYHDRRDFDALDPLTQEEVQRLRAEYAAEHPCPRRTALRAAVRASLIRHGLAKP